MPKVMIIEDDSNMVSLLTMLLNIEGFSVWIPQNHNLKDLLNTVLDERPQIVLLDVNLTNGNSLDLVREIRRNPELNATSILMLSGLNLKTECLQAGANGFIQKPFMPDELIKLIHHMIQ